VLRNVLSTRAKQNRCAFDGASSGWRLLQQSSSMPVTRSSASSSSVLPFVTPQRPIIDFRLPTLKQFTVLRALNDTASTSNGDIDISAVTVGTIDRFDRVLVTKHFHR
jgi:hypothetical protein